MNAFNVWNCRLDNSYDNNIYEHGNIKFQCEPWTMARQCSNVRMYERTIHAFIDSKNYTVCIKKPLDYERNSIMTTTTSINRPNVDQKLSKWQIVLDSWRRANRTSNGSRACVCVCARDTHKMCAYPAYGQSNRIEVDGKSTWCNCRRTIMKAPNWSSTTETKGNAAELSIFGRNGLHGYGVHRNTILVMITLISRLIVLEAQHLNITFFCVCKTYVCGTMRTHTFFLTRFLLRFRQKRLNNRFEQLNWPKKNILENTRAHWKCVAQRATNVI